MVMSDARGLPVFQDRLRQRSGWHRESDNTSAKTCPTIAAAITSQSAAIDGPMT